MESIAVNSLGRVARQVLRHYTENGGTSRIAETRFVGGGEEVIEVEFEDGKYDVWKWQKNPNAGKTFETGNLEGETDKRSFLWVRIAQNEDADAKAA